MRGEQPLVSTKLETGHGVDRIVSFIERQGLFTAWAPAGARPRAMAGEHILY